MKPEQSVDQCGFSRAVGTEQADDVALQRSRESVQHGAIPQPDLQSFEVNYVHVTLLRLGKGACSRNLSAPPGLENQIRKGGYYSLLRCGCLSPRHRSRLAGSLPPAAGSPALTLHSIETAAASKPGPGSDKRWPSNSHSRPLEATP